MTVELVRLDNSGPAELDDCFVRGASGHANAVLAAIETFAPSELLEEVCHSLALSLGVAIGIASPLGNSWRIAAR